MYSSANSFANICLFSAMTPAYCSVTDEILPTDEKNLTSVSSNATLLPETALQTHSLGFSADISVDRIWVTLMQRCASGTFILLRASSAASRTVEIGSLRLEKFIVP